MGELRDDGEKMDELVYRKWTDRMQMDELLGEWMRRWMSIEDEQAEDG